MRLSLRWAERCKRAFERAAPGRALFGIVQGGDDRGAARRERARRWSTSAFDGYAIGGLAVGEPQDGDARRCSRTSTPHAAGRPAALSDGRRHAGRSSSRRWRAASTCSTACCRPATAATAWPSPAAARSICKQRPPRRRSAPARRGEPLPGGARLFARLSASSGQGATRCSAPCCSSAINLAYYQELMAGMRAAIAAGPLRRVPRQTQAGWARGDIPPRCEIAPKGLDAARLTQD